MLPQADQSNCTKIFNSQRAEKSTGKKKNCIVLKIVFNSKALDTKIPLSSSQIPSSPSNPFRDVFVLQLLARLNKAQEMRGRLFSSLALFLKLKEQNRTEPKNSLTCFCIYLCPELPKHNLKAEEYFQNSGHKWRPRSIKPGPLNLETSTDALFILLQPTR